MTENIRYTYIVQCADNTLYTGITTDLERRIIEHNTSPKWATYTKAKRPVTLVRSEPSQTRSQAAAKEHQIKKMRREQKLQLIHDWWLIIYHLIHLQKKRGGV